MLNHISSLTCIVSLYLPSVLSRNIHQLLPPLWPMLSSWICSSANCFFRTCSLHADIEVLRHLLWWMIQTQKKGCQRMPIGIWFGRQLYSYLMTENSFSVVSVNEWETQMVKVEISSQYGSILKAKSKHYRKVRENYSQSIQVSHSLTYQSNKWDHSSHKVYLPQWAI